MRWSGNHGSNDDTIPGEVAKRLEPNRMVGLESIPFEKSRVESVCVIYKFLKVFQGNLGRELTKIALDAVELLRVVRAWGTRRINAEHSK